MIMFKSCPRCSGDLIVGKDAFGDYVTCLQCGHVTYPGVLMALWQGQNPKVVATDVSTQTVQLDVASFA